MNKVSVNLKENSYKIFISQNKEELYRDALLSMIKGRSFFIVTDSNVDKIYGQPFEDLLKDKSLFLGKFVFQAGEGSKTFKTFEELLRALVKARLDRNSCILALGGGVCGDMAGFAASTYMRGIDYIQIPTTLLAMVDSSVGGKTAIDLPEGKNLVGAFYQPKGVFIDVSKLETLPGREISAGLAEVIKYAMILDGDFFAYLHNNLSGINSSDFEVFAHVIAKCCSLKADIVSKDEKEQSLRAILNFGHTFGHALEMVSGYNKFIHGEAVAIGMLMACELAVNLGYFDRDKINALSSLLEGIKLPVKSGLSIDAKTIYDAMMSDKKTKGGKISFIIPDKDIGKVKIVCDVDKEIILQSMRAYL